MVGIVMGHADVPVGRARELAVIDELWAPGAGPSRAVLLRGEAGIGKTSLVRAALVRARAGGLEVLTCQPTAPERELPFCALGDLLEQVPEETIRRLPGAQAAAVQAARTGGLDRVDRAGRADPAEHGTLVARGVLGLLRLLSADGLLALVVDDVQWLDRPTAAALTFAMRRLGTAGVRALVAERGDQRSPELPLGLADWPSTRPLDLGGLDLTSLGAVVRDAVGVQLTRPQLRALAAECGGNPMLAVERVRHPQRPAPALSAAVSAGLLELDPAGLRAAAVVAAAQRPTVDVLLSAGVEREGLRLAVAAGVLQVRGDRVRFAHPLLAEAASALLLPDEERAVHRRLATTAADLAARAYHTARSARGPDDGAARILADAGRAASGYGDHEGAGRYLRQAAELASDPYGPTAVACRLDAGAELILAGDLPAAADCAGQLLAGPLTGSNRARATRLLMWSQVGAGVSYEDELAGFADAVADAARDDGLIAQLYFEMSEICLGMCRLDDGLGYARLAVAAAERAGDTQAAVDALAMVGFAEGMLGLGVTAAAREAYERWDGELRYRASPRMQLACTSAAALDLAAAEELLVQEVRAGRLAGIEAIEVVAQGHLAEVYVRAGRWDEALAICSEAVEHARQATNLQVASAMTCPVATTHALTGRLASARSLAGEGLATARATGDFWYDVSFRAVLGLVALSQGDPSEAVQVLAPAWELMLDRGLGDLALFPVAQVLAEALVDVRRLDEASEVADLLERCPVGGQPWSRGMTARCRALVASARGDDCGAREQVARALQAHADLPEPFERARTLHIAGRVERSGRHWGSARAYLTQAQEAFDVLGARAWSARTASETARLPGRRRTDPAALTTREQDVAGLAAAGLSNRQIAARLFVSVSTVEANLSKVYAKLDVRSRVELAGHVRPAAPLNDGGFP